MWPHLFFSHPKDKHALFNCASWVGHQSTMVLGALSPAATPHRGTTLALYPASTSSPYCHTTHSTFSNFQNTKTSFYFFYFLTLRVAHPQGDRTRVAHPSPVWLRTTAKPKKDKQQTVDKQTNTQPDQDANVPKWHFSKPTHWAFRKPLTLPTMSSIPLVVSAASFSLPCNEP